MTTLAFWGGAGTVTGSKYLLDTGRSRILVDCGLFQGSRDERERNWQDPPFDVHALDAVLLTHAHIDHTGWLPRLVKLGYRGPIYCSKATAALLDILLRDAGRLQEEDADYRNRHNLTRHTPALPLYTEDDARHAMKLVRTVTSPDETVTLTPDLQARLFNAGHILGSRFALVHTGQGDTNRSVLFSGDLGRRDKPILRDLAPPPACDFLLVESTYGDRAHAPESSKDALARAINDAATKKGTLLIPAFAVGRTQEITYLIRELEGEGRIPILPVWVDSPMAHAATNAYQQAVEEQDAEYAAARKHAGRPLVTHNMSHASTKQESRALNERPGPRIIISASGMMTGGRVLHHAMRVLPDPESTILFVGYQSVGTTGRRIKDGEKDVKIHKEWIPVRCRVEAIDGFSSHADWRDILDWLAHMEAAPRRVFVTHGENRGAEALRDRIVERFGWAVEIPRYGEEVQLA